jgi:hypothetical protein
VAPSGVLISHARARRCRDRMDAAPKDPRGSHGSLIRPGWPRDRRSGPFPVLFKSTEASVDDEHVWVLDHAKRCWASAKRTTHKKAASFCSKLPSSPAGRYWLRSAGRVACVRGSRSAPVGRKVMLFGQHIAYVALGASDLPRDGDRTHPLASKPSDLNAPVRVSRLLPESPCGASTGWLARSSTIMTIRWQAVPYTAASGDRPRGRPRV